jgi:hypothetical protein
VSTGKVVQIEIGGGARFNLWEPAPDDPRLWEHTAKDLAIAIRGSAKNRDLGFADSYLAAGEWSLAVEEMAAVLKEDEFVAPVVHALLLRAKRLLGDAGQNTERD